MEPAINIEIIIIIIIIMIIITKMIKIIKIIMMIIMITITINIIIIKNNAYYNSNDNTYKAIFSFIVFSCA